jgi:two-component system, NtrC family, response regulator AtoC
MSSRGRTGDATTLIEPRSQTSEGTRLSLQVLGAGILDSFPLPESGEVLIGRGDEARLRIDDPSISRRHAMVAVHNGVVLIRDLGSANGTRLGERVLVQNETVELAAGDVVDLGSVMLVLQRGFAARRMRRLLPHGYFESRVEEECESAAAAAGRFALVRLHVDGVADEGIAEEGLAEALRSTDVAGLYGPSEYELLLPGAGADEAARSFARIQGSMLARAMPVTCGVALFPRDGRTAEALLSAANAALGGPRSSDLPAVIVVDAAMQRIHRLLQRVAPGNISVLVLGETGTGKEVISETLHRMSPRANGPFLRLNCGGFTESLLESELFGHEKGAFTGAVATKPGLLESADGGTVFLDEIGELPPSLQVKLLRVLEDKQVMRVGALKPRKIDVRFVSATNRDLEDEIGRGAFRQDLYYRVSGVSIVIPPLRERVGEIPHLCRLFAAEAVRQVGGRESVFSPSAMRLLQSYAWPGNIRELRNVIERAVLLSADGLITEEHLPTEKMLGGRIAAAPAGHPAPGVAFDPYAAAAPVPVSAYAATAHSAEAILGGPPAGSLQEEIDDVERRRILAALESCAGNQTRAARMLGISRSTLSARLEQFGLPRPRKR